MEKWVQPRQRAEVAGLGREVRRVGGGSEAARDCWPAASAPPPRPRPRNWPRPAAAAAGFAKLGEHNKNKTPANE